MTNPTLLKRNGKYPKGSFATVAAEAWKRFLKIASTEVDLAFWEIEADSATVKLTPRVSTVNENSRSWEPPPPIVMLVDGVIEALEANEKSAWPTIRSKFYDWVTCGVLESFQSAKFARERRKLTSRDGAFAIVGTNHDDGLVDCDLSLLWSSDDAFTLKTIATRQASADKRTPKKTTALKVRKRQTSKGKK